MEIKQIKSKKARKWAKKNKKKYFHKGCLLTFFFLWSDSKQGHDFWKCVKWTNPSTEKLKKKFPHLFKK